MIPSFSHDDLAAMLEELEVLRDLAQAACDWDDSMTVGDAPVPAHERLQEAVMDWREFVDFRAKRRAAKS